MKFLLTFSLVAASSSSVIFGRTIFGGGGEEIHQVTGKNVFDFELKAKNGAILMEEWLEKASERPIISEMTYYGDTFFHAKQPSSICEYSVREQTVVSNGKQLASSKGGLHYSAKQLAIIPWYFWTELKDFSKFKYNAQHAFCFPESCIRITDSKKEHQLVLKITDQTPSLSQIGVHSHHQPYFGLGAVQWSFVDCGDWELGKVFHLKEQKEPVVEKPVIVVSKLKESPEEKKPIAEEKKPTVVEKKPFLVENSSDEWIEIIETSSSSNDNSSDDEILVLMEDSDDEDQ